MAAFTKFTRAALERYLVMFDQGQLESFQPVTGGIENSNYFLTLSKEQVLREYVLTIVEQYSFEEVSFFNRVLGELARHKLPIPLPERTLDGMSATIFCGKPAFLFPRLKGSHIRQVRAKHCFEIGKFLAVCHAALASLDQTLSEQRKNTYHAAWMKLTLEQVRHRMSGADASLLAGCIAEYEQLSTAEMPRGLIHGDLFRDNALFVDDRLTGVIDFYHTCSDFLLQDIAIAINDWCLDGDDDSDQQQEQDCESRQASRQEPRQESRQNGPSNRQMARQIAPPLATALIAGYECIRTLSTTEIALLKPLQRTSAARFALTRFLSGDPPLKDPGAMLALARGLTNSG